MVEPKTTVSSAPVVVGVPEYGPWLVTPVTSLLIRGKAGTVAPGISEAGRPATEVTDATAAVSTLGSWL
jgi:hypothetical protein